MTCTWRKSCLRDGGMANFWVSTSHMNTGGLPGACALSFRARTSGVTVAVKRRVCRFPAGGRTEKHSSTSGSMLPTEPPAKSRSASSRTTIRTLRSAQIVSSPDVRVWSARRPGVAITTWGLCARADACGRMSEPPVIRTALRDWGDEMALNCS